MQNTFSVLWIVVIDISKTKSETNNGKDSMSSIQEDMQEGETEEDENLPVYPYERLKIGSSDPVPDIDVTKREVYWKLHFI